VLCTASRSEAIWGQAAALAVHVQAKNEFYRDEEELVMDYATASNVEHISIEAAQPNLDLTTLDGLGDKTVILGVISMGDPEPETPEVAAARIRAALKHLPRSG
jgi:methionine synthase II (cobalamin-independent)